jgi:hypothetical protein
MGPRSNSPDTRYDPFKRRLGKLEHGAASADAVLRFADASTRAVSVRHQLKLFCAACARLSFSLEASKPELEASALRVERPVSAYDSLIEMFGRAVDIQRNDKFLFWIVGVCQECIEEEQKAPKTLQ